jgi:hypothetical protein
VALAKACSASLGGRRNGAALLAISVPVVHSRRIVSLRRRSRLRIRLSRDGSMTDRKNGDMQPLEKLVRPGLLRKSLLI